MLNINQFRRLTDQEIVLVREMMAVIITANNMWNKPPLDDPHSFVMSTIKDLIDLIYFTRELMDKQDRPVTISDLGSGLSPYLYVLSREYSPKYVTLKGVELQSELVNLASVYLKNVSMIHSDIRDYDVSGDDIIYSFTPINNYNGMSSWIKHVYTNMKPGAIFIVNSVFSSIDIQYETWGRLKYLRKPK